MTDNEIIAKNCVIKGFDRLFDALYDLQLDLPAAYILASRWIDKSLKADFITKEIADKCPKLPR
jgi:hypothetical protein